MVRTGRSEGAPCTLPTAGVTYWLAFIDPLRQEMTAELQALQDALPALDWLQISTRRGGQIRLTPLDADPEPRTLRRLKADPARRDIVIIAVTSYAMKGDDQKAFAAGCDGYMSKPIDIDALPRVVAEHLAGIDAARGAPRPR